MSPYLPPAWCLVAAFISPRENSHPVGHGCLFSSFLLLPASSSSHLSPSSLSFLILPLLFTAFPSLQRAPGRTSPVPPHLPSPQPGDSSAGLVPRPALVPGVQVPWGRAFRLCAHPGITSRPSSPTLVPGRFPGSLRDWGDRRVFRDTFNQEGAAQCRARCFLLGMWPRGGTSDHQPSHGAPPCPSAQGPTQRLQQSECFGDFWGFLCQRHPGAAPRTQGSPWYNCSI